MKTPFNNGSEPFDPMVQDCWHYYSDGTSQCELLLTMQTAFTSQIYLE